MLGRLHTHASLSSTRRMSSLRQTLEGASRELEAAEAAVSSLETKLEAARALAADKRETFRSARLALREHEDEALKLLVLAPLPTELVSTIFLLLPVDSRLRCREVCRGWCAFLADPRLWRVCDLSASGGVLLRRTPALLRAATERAQGTLEVLDVTGWRGLFQVEVVTEEEGKEEEEDAESLLLVVVRSNAGSLRALRAWDCCGYSDPYLNAEGIEALLTAAPQLRLLDCDLGMSGGEAVQTLRLLENFPYLRLQTLLLNSRDTQVDVPAVAARLAQQATLAFLSISARLDTEPSLGAVTCLVMSSQLQKLTLSGCRLSPESLPALTTMMSSSTLEELTIFNNHLPLFSGAALPAFCAALRSSRLVVLTLGCMRLWDSTAEALLLISACTSHPHLRTIQFQYDDVGDAPGQAVILNALAALRDSSDGLQVLF